MSKQRASADCPNNLRKYRQAKGWERQDLAQRMGVTPSYISNLETGNKEIQQHRRIQLGLLFDRPADDFLPQDVLREREEAARKKENASQAGLEFKADSDPVVTALDAILNELRQIKGILAKNGKETTDQGQ